MNPNPDTAEVDDEINARLAWLSPILLNLGVHRMEASLDGGGDSGDLNEIIYLDAAGEPHDGDAIEKALSDISLENGDALLRLHEGVMQDANDEGNWYDNDGGSVSSAYTVTPDGVFTEFVSISYHEPDWDDDDFEDDYDDDEGMEP